MDKNIRDIKAENITSEAINADHVKIISDGIIVKGDNIILK